MTNVREDKDGEMDLELLRLSSDESEESISQFGKSLHEDQRSETFTWLLKQSMNENHQL